MANNFIFAILLRVMEFVNTIKVSTAYYTMIKYDNIHNAYLYIIITQ